MWIERGFTTQGYQEEFQSVNSECAANFITEVAENIFVLSYKIKTDSTIRVL